MLYFFVGFSESNGFLSSTKKKAYATNIDTVVTTVYDMFNAKFFSVPKLMLLPQVIAKQPMLLIKITPLILLTDYVKSSVVSTITTEIERLNKLIKDVSDDSNHYHYFDVGVLMY